MVYTNAITAISGLEKTPTIAAMPPPSHGPTTGMMFSRPVITPRAAALGMPITAKPIPQHTPISMHWTNVPLI